MVERHFVTVSTSQGTRQVHYRRAGSGPAVVVLHESPLSGRAYIGLIEELARSGCTGIALDNPGFGSSDPLPLEQPEIVDFTDALVETLAALGIARAALYGAHTGACIALDAALRHPERIAAICLDGLPIFTDEERERFLREYTPSFEPRWDGGHILAAYTTRRDMKLFFPWFRKEEATRLAIPVPPAEQLHEEALDLLRAKDTFHLGYKAAFRYRVEEPLARVGVPTAVTARGDEILGAQLARLGAVSPQVAVELLPNDRGAWAAAICRLFAERPAGSDAPAPPATAPVPGRLWRAYARTAGAGELLVRRGGPTPAVDPGGRSAGPAAGPRPLVLLHPSPISGAMLVPLATELARGRPVVVFDSPGYGDSTPLPGEPAIADFARAIAAGIDSLDLGQIDLYGANTGACIAAEIAIADPSRIHALVLDNPPIFDDEQRRELVERLTPPFVIRDDGLQLVAAWSFIRDHAMWFPPYRRDPEHVRPGPPPSLDELHLRTIELLKGGAGYGAGPRAAFSYPIAERWPLLACRTLVTAHGGMNAAYIRLDEGGALVPGAEVSARPAAPAEHAAQLAGFLDAR